MIEELEKKKQFILNKAGEDELQLKSCLNYALQARYSKEEQLSLLKDVLKDEAIIEAVYNYVKKM